MAPAHTHSQIRRMPSPEWPWLPICVFTLYFRAVSVSRRASATECVSGFWTYTCLPRVIAAIAMTAWLWSGVATMTASMPSFISSSITR